MEALGTIVFCLILIAIPIALSYKGRGKQEVKEIKQKVTGMEQQEIDLLAMVNAYLDKNKYKVESLFTIKNGVKVMTLTITPITKKDNNEKK